MGVLPAAPGALPPRAARTARPAPSGPTGRAAGAASRPAGRQAVEGERRVCPASSRFPPRCGKGCCGGARPGRGFASPPLRQCRPGQNPLPSSSPGTWQRRREARPRLAVPWQKSGQGGRGRRAALTAGVAVSGAGLQRGGARCPSACSEPGSGNPSLTRISSVTKPAAVRWLCPQRASSVRLVRAAFAAS